MGKLRLDQTDLLIGQTEEIALQDFRQRIGDVIYQVQMGKVFTITKNGKPVATLARPEPTALELGAAVRVSEKRQADPKNTTRANHTSTRANDG